MFTMDAKSIGDVVIAAMNGDQEAREHWWNKVKQPLPKEWIKQRQGPGGRMLDYIEGHKVVELISDASKGAYSFLVLDARIEEGHPVPLKAKNERGYDDPVVEITCPACGKPYRTVKRFRQQSAKCAHCNHEVPFSLYPGNPVLVRTEPIAHVLGMLIVPGVGVAMQWGSKILQGGSSEQEHALKSATTDALKKCASLLGVALELYDKDDGAQAQETIPTSISGRMNYDFPEPVQRSAAFRAQTPSAQPAPEVMRSGPKPEAQADVAEPAVSGDQAAEAAADGGAQGAVWPAEEVERLNRLRQLMGIPQDNRNMLNPLVSAWSQGKIETWRGLTPANIKDFNDYLESLLYQPGQTA